MPPGLVEDWRTIIKNAQKLINKIPEGVEGQTVGFIKGKGIRIKYDLIEVCKSLLYINKDVTSG